MAKNKSAEKSTVTMEPEMVPMLDATADNIEIIETDEPDNLVAIELASMFDAPEIQGWLDVSAPERAVLANAGDALRGTFLGFYEFPYVFANIDPKTGEVQTKDTVLRVGRFSDATIVTHDEIGRVKNTTHYRVVDCYITASLLRASFDRVPIGARIIIRRTSRTRKIGMGNATVYDVLASPEIVESALSVSIGKNPLVATTPVKQLPAGQ